MVVPMVRVLSKCYLKSCHAYRLISKADQTSFHSDFIRKTWIRQPIHMFHFSVVIKPSSLFHLHLKTCLIFKQGCIKSDHLKLSDSIVIRLEDALQERRCSVVIHRIMFGVHTLRKILQLVKWANQTVRRSSEKVSNVMVNDLFFRSRVGRQLPDCIYFQSSINR